MPDATLQAELDRRLHVTPDDRAILRSGQLPEKYAKSASNLGCMTIGVALLGALAGALFGWNVYPVLPHDRLPDARTFVILTALVGFAASWIAFRRRFGRMIDAVAQRLRRGRVQHATIEGRLETQVEGDSNILVLLANDGRRFQCPVGLRGVTLAGPMKVFFLDFTEVENMEPGGARPFALPQYVVAIELL